MSEWVSVIGSLSQWALQLSGEQSGCVLPKVVGDAVDSNLKCIAYAYNFGLPHTLAVWGRPFFLTLDTFGLDEPWPSATVYRDYEPG